MRILLPFILFSFSVFGQIEFSKTKHDFGELESYSARHVDILLTNRGNKQEWILSIKKPMDVVYITTKQIIEKDSTITIRFQVNPRIKGRFNYTVEVFTSDRGEATPIKLSGLLREIDQNTASSLTACPDFGSSPSGRNPNAFDLTVVTIDKETRKELSNSNVLLIQSGREVWEKKTNNKGLIKAEAILGLSYFLAEHQGYLPAELGAYVNFQRNYIVIELERVQEPDPPIIIPEVDTTTIAVIDPEPEPESEIEPEPEPEPEIIIEIEEDPDLPIIAEETPTPEETPPGLTDLDEDNFDPKYFKPINVVFVLDVSSSMKQVDKIELMKYSLLQLTEKLRPEDKIALVTYANDSRVLLQATSGVNKEAIRKEVMDLEAFGYTAGGKGIKLGFKEAKKTKIQDGTNHVIIITDGAFNRSSEDYEKVVKKYNKEDIHLSVVGIKNKDVHEEDMRRAAEIGGGRYVPIHKLADAQRNLIQEIRVLTFRY